MDFAVWLIAYCVISDLGFKPCSRPGVQYAGHGSFSTFIFVTTTLLVTQKARTKLAIGLNTTTMTPVVRVLVLSFATRPLVGWWARAAIDSRN